MNEELTDQLSIMREQLDEFKAANSRAEEAESKLKESERRARTIESKMKEEERKWTGRLKDSEYREKQSDERLKVEKQGAKEKVDSLIENIKYKLLLKLWTFFYHVEFTSIYNRCMFSLY